LATVGVAPYATARVGPYVPFTYSGAPGIPPHATGVAPSTTGAISHTTGVPSLAPGVAPTTINHVAPNHQLGVSPLITGVSTLDRLNPYGAGVGSNDAGMATLATGVSSLDGVPNYASGVSPRAITKITPNPSTRATPPNSKLAPRGILFDRMENIMCISSVVMNVLVMIKSDCVLYKVHAQP
jgi:hypothetical protein